MLTVSVSHLVSPNMASTNFTCKWNIHAYARHITQNTISKNGNRKIQGVPQSQTAALPRLQEERETDKSKQAQTKQTYEKH